MITQFLFLLLFVLLINYLYRTWDRLKASFNHWMTCDQNEKIEYEHKIFKELMKILIPSILFLLLYSHLFLQ